MIDITADANKSNRNGLFRIREFMNGDLLRISAGAQNLPVTVFLGYVPLRIILPLRGCRVNSNLEVRFTRSPPRGTIGCFTGDR
jgi:hypothetical protein